MTDYERVMQGLDCCVATRPENHVCQQCPYLRRERGAETECFVELMADARMLLGERQVRLMTEADFDNCGYDSLPCWKEARKPTHWSGWAVITYGKMLADAGRARYWTGKPTDEQREAVAWE